MIVLFIYITGLYTAGIYLVVRILVKFNLCVPKNKIMIIYHYIFYQKLLFSISENVSYVVRVCFNVHSALQ